MPKEDSCYNCPDRHRACHDTCPEHKRRTERNRQKKEFLDSDREIREWTIQQKVKFSEFSRKHSPKVHSGINKG